MLAIPIILRAKGENHYYQFLRFCSVAAGGLLLNECKTETKSKDSTIYNQEKTKKYKLNVIAKVSYCFDLSNSDKTLMNRTKPMTENKAWSLHAKRSFSQAVLDLTSAWIQATQYCRPLALYIAVPNMINPTSKGFKKKTFWGKKRKCLSPEFLLFPTMCLVCFLLIPTFEPYLIWFLHFF